MKKYGIEVSQAHAPYPLYVDGRDDLNEICFEVIEKCMAICRYLDCKYLVIHPITLSFEHDREYERKVNLEYYTRCIPFCKKYGVMICLENMVSGDEVYFLPCFHCFHKSCIKSWLEKKEACPKCN